ncbi:MAG TPA: hypothetical protein VGA69_09820 [Nitriliruptorales bacterium]
MMLVTDLLLLATEDGIPPEHIGAQIALPLGILFFCGSVYLLLWSIYGARKGAWVYLTSFFGFNVLLGVFWWFGAPGTVVATGLRNFPGQSADAYAGAWHPYETDSERARFFPDADEFEEFQTPFAYMGLPEDADTAGNEMFDFIQGDLDQAASRMAGLYLPTDESGQPRLGGQRRATIEAFITDNGGAVVGDMTQRFEITNAEGEPETVPGAVEATITRASPFFTARVASEPDGDLARRVTDANGHRTASARLELVANFTGTNPDGRPVRGELVVEEQTLFAFKDPGALWFPSAIWTLIAFIGFAGSAYFLDALEQREKRAKQQVVEEPMEVTVGAPA